MHKVLSTTCYMNYTQANTNRKSASITLEKKIN